MSFPIGKILSHQVGALPPLPPTVQGSLDSPVVSSGSASQTPLPSSQGFRMERLSPVVQWVNDVNCDPTEIHKSKLSHIISTFFNFHLLLDRSATREFCQLVYCTDRNIVESCIRELVQKIELAPDPHPHYTAALGYFLRHVDIDHLNPHLLVITGRCLIKKLDPHTIHVTAATEPYIRDLLEALDATFIRMVEARVTHLEKEGLYKDFKTVLERLASNTFYPISFQARILIVNLSDNIGDNETQWHKIKMASWSAFNGLVKILGGLAGTDPQKILDGSLSVMEAIQNGLEIAGGVEEIKRAFSSFPHKQQKSYHLALRDIQWPLFKAAASGSREDCHDAFHLIQAIYVKKTSEELLFGIVALIKKISPYMVPEARLQSVVWFIDLFQNKESWGVVPTNPLKGKEIPEAPREEIIRSLLELACDKQVPGLSETAIEALKELKRFFCVKERSVGREILERMIPDIDGAVQSIPPKNIPLDLCPIGSFLSRIPQQGEVLSSIELGIHAIQRTLNRSSGSSFKSHLEKLRDNIKADEYRQVETNQLYVPTLCVSHRHALHSIDTAKPTDDVITGFLASDKKVLVIYAHGGTGKTVITQRLEERYLDEYLHDEEGKRIIPHRIELTGLQDPVHSAIEEGLKNKGFTESQIEEVKQLPGLIIFDAVDEGRCNGQRLTAIHPLYFTNRLYQWPQSKVIFTIRLDDAAGAATIDPKQFYPYRNEGRESKQPALLQEIYLCHYQPENRRAYLDQYISHAPQEWLEENLEWTSDRYLEMISDIPGADELSKIPFTLRLLAEVLPSLVQKAVESNGGTFNPEALELTQTMLYEEFLIKWFDREETKLIGRSDIPPEMAREGVTEVSWSYSMQLAAKMRSVGGADGITKVVYRDFAGRINPEWEPFFGEAPQTQINLRMAPLKRTGHEFAFLHKHIRDFLATRYGFLQNLEKEMQEAGATAYET